MKPKASHKSRSGVRFIAVMGAFAVSAGLLLGGCPGIDPQVTTPIPQKGEKGDKGDQGDAGLEGPKGDQGSQGEEGPAGGTITAHSQLSGLDADDHPQYVMNGEANAVTGPMLANAAVGLPKIDTAGAGANQIVKFVQGQGLVWADDETGPPGSGDISAVYADDGLTGGATAGDAHLSVGAGTGIAVGADTVSVDTNWADGRYVNEGQPNSITSAMIVDNAVGSSEIASGAVESSEIASNAVGLSEMANDSVGLAELNTTNSGSSGEYLKHTGSGMEWDTVSGGNCLWSEGSGGRIYYNGGNVGIGTSTPSHKLTVDGPEDTLRLIGPSGPYRHNAQLNFGDANYAYIKEDVDDKLRFYADRFAILNGYVGLNVDDPGYRLTLPNSSSSSGRGLANRWDTYSSARWKENVEQVDDALNKVLRLRGVTFEWSGEALEEQAIQTKHGPIFPAVERRDIGFIAEEVGAVFPEIVTWESDGSGFAKGLDYGRIVPVLVEAIRQLRLEKDEQIAKLEARLEALEALINQR